MIFLHEGKIKGFLMAFVTCSISMTISVQNKQKVKSFEVTSSDRWSYIYHVKKNSRFFRFWSVSGTPPVCFLSRSVFCPGLFFAPVCLRFEGLIHYETKIFKVMVCFWPIKMQRMDYNWCLKLVFIFWCRKYVEIFAYLFCILL